MNIQAFMQKDEIGIQAGGPGSGRHATMNVLKGHGWHSRNGMQFTHDIHQGHRISVDIDGGWHHSKVLPSGSGQYVGNGYDSADLNTHLLNYNWGGKTGRHGVGGR